MNKCITFGEIMMRLNPEGYLRLIQATKLEVSFAGGEANVAVALANFGVKASYVTKLPENDIGKAAMNDIRKYGVDVSDIVIGGNRLGVYYVEKGASQRPSTVIYDRAGSSIACATRSDFDWDNIFKDATWFHFTGITPALGGELPEICLDACKAAQRKGITVSCDLNYRGKLWSSKKAGEVMSNLMPYVTLCIANEEDSAKVFGIKAIHTDLEAGVLKQEAYVGVAEELVKRFGFKKVAITLRRSISASENDWAGMLYDSKSSSAFFSPTYNIKIVDRVGGGDSFGGALIYSSMNQYNDQEAINFAVAASCLKHSIEHDFSLFSVAEVQSLATGNASGRVQR